MGGGAVRIVRRVLTLTLLAFAVWSLGNAGWIHAKAWIAQQLIGRAWERSKLAGRPHRPWAWADTHPVAKLVAPRLGVERFILAGDSGRTLAFGPGHRYGTPLPGERGNSVVSAHRDTHFAFLRDLVPGDVLQVERPDGSVHAFAVAHADVVRSDRAALTLWFGARLLTLVTCFPFDAVSPRTPLRYVVVAQAAAGRQTRTLKP